MSAINAERIDTAGDDDDPRWTLQAIDSESTQLVYLDRCDFLREFEERVNGEGRLNKSDAYVRADLSRLLERERASAPVAPVAPAPVVRLASAENEALIDPSITARPRTSPLPEPQSLALPDG